MAKNGPCDVQIQIQILIPVVEKPDVCWPKRWGSFRQAKLSRKYIDLLPLPVTRFARFADGSDGGGTDVLSDLHL